MVAILVFILKWAPEWLATGDLTGKEKAEEVGRTRTAVLATLAGLIAVVGAIFTGLSYRLNQGGQITERFTRATDQLGNSALDVRIGGIYALERLARDSRDDHPQVMEVLTAYVRVHAPWTPKPTGSSAPNDAAGTTRDGLRLVLSALAIAAIKRLATSDEFPAVGAIGAPATEAAQLEESELSSPPLPSDVLAAMSVIGRRDRSHDRPDTQLRLVRTDLRRLVLPRDHSHLERANLFGAHLEEASLPHAHLEGAILENAHLEHAELLQEAHLEGANLRNAHLERAELSEAHLQGAILMNAHLEGARLYDAHLEGAFLSEARLDDAWLVGAHLEGAWLPKARIHRATLHDVHLERAHLSSAYLDAWFARAHLQRADLTGAHLDGAHQLDEADLSDAYYDEGTTWPDGFDPEAAGARRLLPKEIMLGGTPTKLLP